MKKYVVSMVLAITMVAPLSVFAQTSTQALSMKVGGTLLIKVVSELTEGLTTSDPTPITLTLSGATEAGLAVGATTSDESTRLRMTSYTDTEHPRKITAGLTAGNTVSLWENSNTILRVGLLEPNDNFANYSTQGGSLKGMQVLGSPDGVFTQTLVENIGTAWSGIAAGDGYKIRYEFDQKALGAPTAPIKNATVTFTITE